MIAITPMKIFLRKPVLLLFAFGLFLTLFLFVNVCITGYVIGSDGLGYYAHLRSMLVDGDIQFANEFLEYNQFGQAVPNPHLRTVTDHVPNKYFIGPALLWVPFFLVAHTLTILANQFGFALEPDGYSVLYQFFIGFGSIIYGLAGLSLIYKITIRFFHKNEALIATSLIALGTNVFYYLTNEPTMSHSMSMFAVSLFAFIWVSDVGNRQKGAVVLLGLTAGLMVLIRSQNALFLVLLVLEWIRFLKIESDFVSRFRKQIVEFGVFGITFLITLLPQFVVWKILYGHFLFYSYEGEGFNFANPHLLDSLFSARHGLISWTPAILLALAGVLLFLRKQPKFGLALIVAFILQWYLNASWHCWWFGHSFGGRAYINCSFIFAIGIAMFLTTTKKWVVPTRFLLAALIGWNLLFVAQYTLGMLPYGDAVDFKQVLHNQFNVLGKIFSIFSKII
jgi:hypothetical protein